MNLLYAVHSTGSLYRCRIRHGAANGMPVMHARGPHGLPRQIQHVTPLHVHPSLSCTAATSSCCCLPATQAPTAPDPHPEAAAGAAVACPAALAHHSVSRSVLGAAVLPLLLPPLQHALQRLSPAHRPPTTPPVKQQSETAAVRWRCGSGRWCQTQHRQEHQPRQQHLHRCCHPGPWLSTRGCQRSQGATAAPGGCLLGSHTLIHGPPRWSTPRAPHLPRRRQQQQQTMLPCYSRHEYFLGLAQ